MAGKKVCLRLGSAGRLCESITCHAVNVYVCVFVFCQSRLNDTDELVCIAKVCFTGDWYSR